MAGRATGRGTTGQRPSRADLLTHVEADLLGCELVRGPAGTAVVRPSSGPAFAVEVRRERRRLIDLHVLAVHVDGPPTELRDAAVLFHHSGQLRRKGLVGRVRGGDRAAVTAFRDELMATGQLDAAVRPLDFTRFELRCHEGVWRATLELMGASYVRTTFPPSARYVRLDGEQFAALVDTVGVLHARLPGREPTPVREGGDVPPPGAMGPGSAEQSPRATDHLPRRAR